MAVFIHALVQLWIVHKFFLVIYVTFTCFPKAFFFIIIIADVEGGNNGTIFPFLS